MIGNRNILWSDAFYDHFRWNDLADLEIYQLNTETFSVEKKKTITKNNCMYFSVTYEDQLVKAISLGYLSWDH